MDQVEAVLGRWTLVEIYSGMKVGRNNGTQRSDCMQIVEGVRMDGSKYL